MPRRSLRCTFPLRSALASLGGLALWLAAGCAAREPVDYSGPLAEWPEYGGDKGGLRYSPLDQIRPDNVDRLEPAWVFHHGDVSDGSDGTLRTSFNATPIVVGESLYFCTGKNRVFALDAESGAQRWVFDPVQRLTRGPGPYPRTCRGVAHWRDPQAPAGAACAARIYTGTLDAQLIALDAASGAPCADFGAQGRVELREGVGTAQPWEYYPTSPPLVIRDVVVVGALVADNLRADAPAGVVRAFDLRSGALRWAWDPVPPGWDPAARSREDGAYTAGTPNVWSILSGDEARGLVFVPTGNASPDYYAGDRRGLDHYASSTVALDAATGEVRWAFQSVHHDVWDYDVASQPTLHEIEVAGERRAAVIQPTKMGFVFLLDRESGERLDPAPEQPVPARDVPGEVATPTQPRPGRIPPLHPTRFGPEDAWGFTPWDRKACAERIAALRSEGIFTPPSLEGSIHYPSSAGGANWGGAAIDARRGILYLNTMRIPSVVQLIPRAQYEKLDPADYAYPTELYPMAGTPYAVKRSPLLSPLGAPCNAPPWGLLHAVDLASGQVLWESTLGSTRDQAPFPLWLELGSPNLGGPIVTAGGLVFIGATTDRFLRAFDAASGELVWKSRLPYTANATPISYRLHPDSKQFVVVASGGHGWSEPGDALIAWALAD